MVFALVLIVHVLLSLLLIVVILLQGGRGSLGETIGGGAAQSLFGGGANTVMTKITAIGAGLFMTTCVALAMLSTAHGRSIVEQLPAMADHLPIPLPTPSTSLPSVPQPPTKDTMRPSSPQPAQPPTQHDTPNTSSQTSPR